MTGKGRVVGEVTNSAVTARGRTQQRAAAQLVDRAVRDARIAAAAARASDAQVAIQANAERRALAVAAAELAIAGAERAERDANAAALEELLSAVRALRADGLTVARIAELLQLPVPRVRQFIKQARTTGTPAAPPDTGEG
jgi:hypothetical protein